MDCLLLDNEAVAQSIDIGSHLKYSRPWSVILGQQLGSNTRLLDLRIVNEETTSLHDLCHIFDALKHNSTLKSLSIKDSAKQQTHPATNASNPTLKKENYAKNLENNKSLTSLSLINVQLSGNIQSLADAVSHNKTLQKLTILDNTLNEKDLKQLFDGLLFNTTLDGLNIPRSLSKSSIYLQLMSFVTKNQSNKLKNKEYVPPKQPTIDWDISKSLEKIEVSDVRASLENKAPHSIKQEIQEESDDCNESGNNFSYKNQQDEAQMIIDQLVQQNELLRDQIDMLQTGGLERIAELDKYKEQNAWLIDENEKLRLEISMLRNTLDIKENGHGNRASLHDSYISSLGHDIPYRDIVLGRCVGSGTYGDVFKAQWHGQNIAVKRIKLTNLDNARIDDLLHESRTVRRLHHKHIVMSMGTTVDPETQIMLVMEYMKHGSLQELLFPLRKGPVKLERNQILQLALDIAKGLNYLHCFTPKIIHRDLKCANILLYHKKTRAKISDFGTARYLNQNSLAKTVVGTIGYIAPELFEDVQVRVDEASFKDGYNEKADVYSFGMVLLVLATSTPSVPTTRDPIELRNKIDSALRASISMGDDEQFKQLVRDCCDINPAKRPSMKQCIDMLKSLRQIHYIHDA